MDAIDRARQALSAIPADLPREQWVRVGMAIQAAGLTFDDFDTWSQQGATYNAKDARDAWRSFKPGGGVGTGTLYKMALDNGWRPEEENALPSSHKAPAPSRQIKMASRPAETAAEVWERCIPATDTHPYVQKKQGVTEGLRVLPQDDRLTIKGERVAGALVVPVTRLDGTLSSLQFIAPPELGKRLKEKINTDKLNLPGPKMEGWFTVGEMLPGGVVYVCEGIGQAWACWKATGNAAVVCCGWSRVRTVAVGLRQLDASAQLVLVPDVGKEQAAEQIASEVRAAVARMPEGWPQNCDVNDLALQEGFDALESLLCRASDPPNPEGRFKLLTIEDLRKLPPLEWRVRGVLPATGLAALYGPSASGKSFLAFDMACAIAEGHRWFDCRVEAAPVVYVALEGEAGFKLRAQAWEAYRGYALPDRLRMVLQPFRLTELLDVHELAAVVPAGAVVFLDTLNRAAPTADENSSKDMGQILEAAKLLQSLTGGLVVLVHHTGKDSGKGLRGHSSLFAAMDAVVEVSRDRDHREWRVAKAKDGQDGDTHPFRLQIETLGIDAYGDPVTSCVVVADNTALAVKRTKVPQGGNQRPVLEALRPLFPNGQVGKPGVPPLRPAISLADAIAIGASKLEDVEPRRRTTRAKEAVNGLISGGVLGCREGWLWLQS